MKTMAASKFKEQCLSVIENVGEEGIVITKHGKPIAKLISYREAPSGLIGSLENSLKIHGDILSTGACWEATK